MKILLEDYKRKLELLKDLLPSAIPKNNSIDAIINAEKLVSKIYDYKDFINDIERAIERENNKPIEELESTLKVKTDRETALAWWKELLEEKGLDFCESLLDDYLPTFYGRNDEPIKRNINFITGREIEIIYHGYNG